MLDGSGEAAVEFDDWSVLWTGETSLGQWSRLRFWCNSSSSAGRGIPSSWLKDRASNQSSSFWKGGLREEDEGAGRAHRRALGFKPDWQGWEKTRKQYGSRGVPDADRARWHLKVVFSGCFYRFFEIKWLTAYQGDKQYYSHRFFFTFLIHGSSTYPALFSNFAKKQKKILFIIYIVSTLSTTMTAAAHRLSGARSQQATVSGKKAVGESSGRNFSTNFPILRPKSCVLGRHSGSA